MRDPFSEMVGHDQALDQLRSQLSSGRLAHAYLFVGEAGLGKSTAARLLAAALLPEAPLHRHPDYWEDDRRDNLRSVAGRALQGLARLLKARRPAGAGSGTNPGRQGLAVAPVPPAPE